jgi:hypothetical protein
MRFGTRWLMVHLATLGGVAALGCVAGAGARGRPGPVPGIGAAPPGSFMGVRVHVTRPVYRGDDFTGDVLGTLVRARVEDRLRRLGFELAAPVDAEALRISLFGRVWPAEPWLGPAAGFRIETSAKVERRGAALAEVRVRSPGSARSGWEEDLTFDDQANNIAAELIQALLAEPRLVAFAQTRAAERREEAERRARASAPPLPSPRGAVAAQPLGRGRAASGRTLTLPAPVAAPSEPVRVKLAVLGLEDLGGVLSPEDGDQVLGYFAAELAEGLGFDLLPLAASRPHLPRGGCLDDGCRSRIARALGARRLVELRLARSQDTCAMAATLHDVLAETAQEAVSLKSSCSGEALLESAEELLAQLETMERGDEALAAE